MIRIAESSLWLGHAGDARSPRALHETGIAAVVDVAMEEPPAALTRDLVYCRFPLLDGTGNAPWRIQAAVDTVAALLRAEVPTLVCCGAGMSRSPVIAAAALTRLSGCSLDEALIAVTRSRPSDVSPALLADVRRALL